MSTTITIRTDEETKNEASAIFKKLGLDMSTGINLFLKQVVISNGIPFAIQVDKER